jgi:hypothetical protein
MMPEADAADAADTGQVAEGRRGFLTADEHRLGGQAIG